MFSSSSFVVPGNSVDSSVSSPYHLPHLYAVYHICTIGSWETVVDRQLKLLVTSGLYEKLTALWISIIGPHADTWSPPSFIGGKTVVKFRSTNPNVYEKGALRILQSEFSLDQQPKQSPDERIYPAADSTSPWTSLSSHSPNHASNRRYCLYFHTKGVSHNTPTRAANIQDWAELMEYATISRHDLCIKALDLGYYTAGVNLLRLPSWHYSGNFWWVNAKYVLSLAPLELMEQRHLDDAQSRYTACEMWLGNSSFLPDPPSAASFASSSLSFGAPLLTQAPKASAHHMDNFSISSHNSFIAATPPSDENLPHYTREHKNNNKMFCLFMSFKPNHYEERFPKALYENLLIEPSAPSSQHSSFSILSATWGNKDVTREVQNWIYSNSFVRLPWPDRNRILSDPLPGQFKEFKCLFAYNLAKYLQIENEMTTGSKDEIVFGYCGGTRVCATQRLE